MEAFHNTLIRKEWERSSVTLPPKVSGGPNARVGQNCWVLDDILTSDHSIPERYFVEAPHGVVENFRSLLSRDVYSEGDAQVLYNYVMSRKGRDVQAIPGHARAMACR